MLIPGNVEATVFRIYVTTLKYSHKIGLESAWKETSIQKPHCS